MNPSDPQARVSFPKTGQSCLVDRDDTLVDATFRHDLPIRFRCERAVCTTCLVEVLAGMEHLSSPGDREKQTLASVGAPGNCRLACQCQVLGDVQLDYVPLLDPRRRPKAKDDGSPL